MAREKTVPVRLSEREIEMLREIKEEVGTTNASETMRYNLSYVHQAVVVNKKPQVKGK